MGWTNSHLHRFESGAAVYGIVDPDWPDHELDEVDVPLTALGSEFRYRYDFGDDWCHTVLVLGAGGETPGCVDGAGGCPPEDCGGIGGYAQLLDTLADPRDPEHVRMCQWAGVLPDFDLERSDRDVRDMAGAVPASVRLVLDLAHEGIRLTPGGRLNRAFVRLVQEQRPGWAFWERPAALEEDILPLMALHELLRFVGLLRLRHGVVTPIRAAASDVEVVRRLRRGIGEETFEGSIVGTAAGWLAEHGPTEVTELAEVAFDMLGRGWMAGERPIEASDVEMALHRLSSLLRGLDVIGADDRWRTWEPGPSVRALLPRAASLAAYFENQRHRYPDAEGAGGGQE